MTKREILNTNEIVSHFQCELCAAEKPPDVTPRDWASFNVGWTLLGIQVWCTRHDVNVIHIDFEGQKHPSNTTRNILPSAE